ncbi:MAG TPA: F0F1 ATP synthase subunit B [Myxococcales bacterium]|nr:F0F1 ATP synthase subunit B [Myxococcales bacterium]
MDHRHLRPAHRGPGKVRLGAHPPDDRDAREDIADALESARRERAEAEKAAAEMHAALEKARQEAAEMVRRNQQEVAAAKAESMEEARRQSEELLKQARATIEEERRAAVAELRSQVVDLAIEAAGRLLATQMDEKKQRQLVEEYLEKLPKEARV